MFQMLEQTAVLLQQARCLEKVSMCYFPYERQCASQLAQIKQSVCDLATLLQDLGSLPDGIMNSVTGDELWAMRSLSFSINRELLRLITLRGSKECGKAAIRMRDTTDKNTSTVPLSNVKRQYRARQGRRSRPPRQVCTDVLFHNNIALPTDIIVELRSEAYL